MTIKTSPLRERKEDIDIISNHVLNQYNMMNGTNKKILPDTMEVLCNWDWPDNVRELENAIEYAYCKAEGDEIPVSYTHLDVYKRQSLVSLFYTFPFYCFPASIQNNKKQALYTCLIEAIF